MNEMPSKNDETQAGASPPVPPQSKPTGATEETRHPDHTRPAVEAQPSRTRAQPNQRPRKARPNAPSKRRASQRASAAPSAAPVQQAPVRKRAAPRREQVPPSQSGLYFPWWSLVIMVGTVGVVAFGLLFAFTELSEPAAPGDQVPRVEVITAQPTLSEDFGGSAGQAAAPAEGAWPTAIPRAQPSATVALPTPVPTQTLPPGNFSIGTSVQVVGVGEAKLNVRSAPGLEGTLIMRAEEGSFFAIVGGPQDVDGYEWWKIEDPDDPARVGWAARNFLMVTSQ